MFYNIDGDGDSTWGTQPDSFYNGGRFFGCLMGDCDESDVEDDLVCVQCEDGSEPDGRSSTCVQCATGYAGVGGWCGQCLDGQEASPDNMSCMSCNAGRAGTGGECGQCDDGSEPAFNLQSCQPCRAGSAGTRGTCDLTCAVGTAPNSARTLKEAPQAAMSHAVLLSRLVYRRLIADVGL